MSSSYSSAHSSYLLANSRLSRAEYTFCSLLDLSASSKIPLSSADHLTRGRSMRTRAAPAFGTAHEISTILHKRRRSFRALLVRCPLAHLIDEACSRLSRNLTR